MSSDLFQQRISCVVCEQTLPPKRHEDEDDPGYFPSSLSTYGPTEEPERACEDITRLLGYTKTLTDTIWSQLNLLRLAEEDEKVAGDRGIDSVDDYVERLWKLCPLLSDIHEECGRRLKQLDQWVHARWHEHNQRTPPAVTPETNQP